jgi:hypothetical protein
MHLKGNKNKVTGTWEIIFSSIKFFSQHILIRIAFKTSDQVQGQGVRPIGKAQSRRRRDEPSKEAYNTAIGRLPASGGLDGVLKPILLILLPHFILAHRH